MIGKEMLLIVIAKQIGQLFFHLERIGCFMSMVISTQGTVLMLLMIFRR